MESNIVFTSNNNFHSKPFTTSEIIASYCNIDLDSVHRLIRNNVTDLEEFGVCRFEIRKLQNRNGGRPEKIYHLNEQQATLLITYLKNTAPVKRFKKILTREFYKMRDELVKREIIRSIGIQSHKALTDVIKEYYSDSGNNWSYRNFAELINNHVLGMNTQSYKEHCKITKGNLRDFLPEKQLQELQKTESLVKALIALGYSYQQIKKFLSQLNNSKLVS